MGRTFSREGELELGLETRVFGEDPLLSEDWPSAWVPFTVEVRPEDDCLVLAAAGHLDEWTAGALLRTLSAVCEPSFREVHLDLRGVDGAESADEVLKRCQEFAEGRRLRFSVSVAPTGVPGTSTDPLAAAG